MDDDQAQRSQELNSRCGFASWPTFLVTLLCVSLHVSLAIHLWPCKCMRGLMAMMTIRKCDGNSPSSLKLSLVNIPIFRYMSNHALSLESSKSCPRLDSRCVWFIFYNACTLSPAGLLITPIIMTKSPPGSSRGVFATTTEQRAELGPRQKHHCITIKHTENVKSQKPGLLGHKSQIQKGLLCSTSSMITIVKQVSHMRAMRSKGGKMATCHEKSRLLLSFFSRAHTRKSQWVVTVTKYQPWLFALEL